MTTIAELLKDSAEQIESDSARLDAELLLAEVMAKPRSYFFTWPEEVVATDVFDRFNALLERRKRGEPVAHIVGRQGFWSLQLAVNTATLIPRPDTEVLVETALALLPAEGVTFIDAGTGTGAIALALKDERPAWHAFACDFSFAAASLAVTNARMNALNLLVFCGDWLEAMASESIDLLVANPPYICADDPHLQQGDVRFEPMTALVAPRNGLADIATLAEQGLRVLKANGFILVEHGYDQREAVANILLDYGYLGVECVKDYGGNWRASYARRAA